MCATPTSQIVDTISPPSRFDTLSQWLTWQESLHFTAVDLGLERCREVAKRMELLQPNFKVITVAGTNGKGSSVAMLDTILRKSGYLVGSYTSPHLVHYNERIRIDGVEVNDATLCQSFSKIDQAREDISLTYFEFGTLAALDIFCNAGIELAIMEVGLGGRLDAVNIIDTDVALVCSIDIDHENWLGRDRNTIGYEKAGIFRTGRPAICADLSSPSSVIDYAKIVGSPFYQAGKDYTFEVHEDDWSWRSDAINLTGLPKPSCYNDIQIHNAAGVLMVLNTLSEQFPVEIENVTDSLRDFQLQGRLQIVPEAIPFILDVAHNRQAAENLSKSLTKLPFATATHMVIGMLKDKPHSTIFSELDQAADHWYLASLEDDRGASSQQLEEELYKTGRRDNVNIFSDVTEALEQARDKACAGDRIVVTGSFVTVGAAIKSLNIEC